MASSYFFQKMVTQDRERQAQKIKPNSKARKPKTILFQSKTASVEDLSKKCRICLKQGIIPIFGDENHPDVSENVKTFAAINLDDRDDFPKNLCEACIALLKSAVLLRKTAQQSEKYLNNIYHRNQQGYHDSDAFINSENNIVDNEPDIPIDTGFSGSEPESEPVHSNVKSKNNVLKNKLRKLNMFDANLLFPRKTNAKVRIQCSICKGLLTPKSYKKHLQRHSLASRMICEICGKMYRRDNIDVHVQSHSTTLPFQCKLCPYRGRFLISLQQHMRVHTGKKPYACDKCPRQFTCRSNLNKHLLVHAKIRPHTCVHCGKGFHSNSIMEDHINSYHLGIKHTCNVCGNEFVTRKSLRKHELKIHKRAKYLSGRPLYLQPEYNKTQS